MYIILCNTVAYNNIVYGVRDVQYNNDIGSRRNKKYKMQLYVCILIPNNVIIDVGSCKMYNNNNTNKY